MCNKSAAIDLDFTQDLTGTRIDRLEGAMYACGVEDGSDYRSPEAPKSDASDAPSKQLAPKMSFFVFYQEQGCWAWQRMDASENVLASSSGKFMLYSECVSDARRNGWRGKPLALFLPQKRRN